MAASTEHGEPLLIGKDISWKSIEKIDLRVKHFTPLAVVDEDKIKEAQRFKPYALLLVESPHLPREASMPVVHKVDFRNLWEVFKERGVRRKEEVIVFYIPSSGLLPGIKPKLHIFIYPKGHQEKIHDPVFRPDATKARFKPIAEWRPKQ